MRKYILLTLLFCLVPLRAWALEVTPYLNLFPVNPAFVMGSKLKNPGTGATIAEPDYNVSLGFFGALGLMFNERFLLEVEVGTTTLEIGSLSGAQGEEGDQLKIDNLLINAYYRSRGWEHETGLFTYHYYFGGGAGQAKQDLFLANVTRGSDQSMAWQAVLGLELAPTHMRQGVNGSLLFQYKFLSIADGQLGAVEAGHNAHFLSIGIRFY
ncbi:MULTISPECIES: hypothetical protein [unclassified Nitrospina]|uniref:hypothetical protein n=1 Tax=unclassified Nitrospina TaxID=2638683 RepID=UPI003F99AAD8